MYVFTPEKRRGNNGVMLTEYLGIGDVRELLRELCYSFKGLDKPIVMYPISAPIKETKETSALFSTLSVC